MSEATEASKAKQKQFVTEMLDSIGRTVYGVIECGFLPAEWDGHELRALLADSFKAAATTSRIVTEPRSARARDYRNHCRVTAGL